MLNQYRALRLNYTTDLSCGLKFKHTVGYEICTVGLKFSINVSTLLYYVQYSTGTIGYVLWAYCGLLSLCCGPKVSWEICAVAYSPVYLRPKGR